MYLYGLIFLSLFCSTVFSFIEDTFYLKYKQAYSKNTYFPAMENDQYSISSAQAYSFQRKFVQFLTADKKHHGYKPALTSVSQQKSYKINTPILGIIVPKVDLQNFDIVYSKHFLNLSIEPKIGFKLKRSIKKPVKNISQLKKNIHYIFPVVEFSEKRFLDLNKLHFSDLIMSNTGFSSYIKGVPLSVGDLNNINMDIYHNKKKLELDYFSVNQDFIYTTLIWTINTALDNGWSINSGDVIFSSSFTDTLATKKGTYIIDFLDMTSIVFEVK